MTNTPPINSGLVYDPDGFVFPGIALPVRVEDPSQFGEFLAHYVKKACERASEDKYDDGFREGHCIGYDEGYEDGREAR